jgi:hypothetical protein
MAAAATSSSTTISPVPIITSFPLNPLTAQFTPPSDCTGIYESYVYLVGQDTTCVPPSFGISSTSYYSPGLICPSGYSTACHDTTGVSSITTVTCCPVLSDIGVTLSCVPTPSRLADIWSTLFCTWVAPSDGTTLMATLSSANGVTSTSAVPFSWPEGLNAYGVRMVYESSDLSAAATTSSQTSSHTSSSTSSTTTTSSSTSTSSTSSPTSSGTTNAGLSIGAKVAIGVIIPVVALIALGLAFFCYRRRKQTYKPVLAHQSPSSPQDNKPPPLYGGAAGPTGTYELSEQQRQSELPGDQGLPNQRSPVELPTERRYVYSRGE